MKRFFILLALLTFISIVLKGHALGFSCNSRIVSTGDTKLEVKAKCGEPTSREMWIEENIQKFGPSIEHRVFVNVEEWTYNLGPNQFIRILRFNNGRLVHIETGGYGSTSNHLSDYGCERQIVSIGDREMEVRMKCGEPTSKEVTHEELTQFISPDTKRRSLIVVKEWMYNLGPNRLVRIYRFKNGRVVDIKTGGYGF